MSDRSLHALAIERPTTLQAFGNVFGIGEHKRDTYGLEFLAVIREYASSREDLPFPEAGIDTNPTSKPISHMEQQKQLHAKAYAPWTEEEDGKLRRYYSEGLSVSEIASKMERNNGSIRSRIKKLGLSD